MGRPAAAGGTVTRQAGPQNWLALFQTAGEGRAGATTLNHQMCFLQGHAGLEHSLGAWKCWKSGLTDPPSVPSWARPGLPAAEASVPTEPMSSFPSVRESHLPYWLPNAQTPGRGGHPAPGPHTRPFGGFARPPTPSPAPVEAGAPSWSRQTRPQRDGAHTADGLVPARGRPGDRLQPRAALTGRACWPRAKRGEPATGSRASCPRADAEAKARGAQAPPRCRR